jgi:choline kinase
MKEKLLNGLNNSNLIGWNIVFCHNDAQENNILKTSHGIRLIDFEYAEFSFQGVDIGNFFNEFTMDYTYDKYPYYKVNNDSYPKIFIYLSI